MSSARLFASGGSAKGIAETNSQPVDVFRRHIFPPPYGKLRRIAERLGRPEKWVYDQSRGEDPLTLTLALEVLSEHQIQVTEDACAELLAPLGLLVMRHRAEVPVHGPISAHGQILGGLASLEAEFAAAIGNDGQIDAREAARLAAIGGELKGRVEIFLSVLRRGDQ